MFPRELLDCHLQSLSRTTNFAARFLLLLASTSAMPTHAEKKQGVARIISFKTSQYRRFLPV
jgi:hypothetical protein